MLQEVADAVVLRGLVARACSNEYARAEAVDAGHGVNDDAHPVVHGGDDVFEHSWIVQQLHDERVTSMHFHVR